MREGTNAMQHLTTAGRAATGTLDLVRRGGLAVSRLGWRRGLALALAGTLGVTFAGAGAWVTTRPGLAELEAEAPVSVYLQDDTSAPLLLAHGVTAEYVPLAGMPEYLPLAVIAVEDRRFREHGGIDFRAIARAVGRNLRAGGVVQGGSTITQQLVKISYLQPERSYLRKAHEALLAREMEDELGKDAILERYLNRVYLGQGVHGVGAASRLYFGRPVGEISLAQAAVLAATIRSPSQVNPLGDVDAVRARATMVVDLMERQGLVAAGPAGAARLEISTTSFGGPAPAYGGWFADWVAGQAAAAGQRSGEVTVRTTLDPALQARAEATVAAALQGLPMQAALVALRPDGTVAAMVGGRDYDESQFNRASDALRQPGSTFKLMVYLAALAEGVRPDDRIMDEPVDIDGWTPGNFDGRFHGPVTLREAFAHSLNAATVNLARGIGIERVAAAARTLGIEADLTETPSLALGASEVTLLDLTEAYAAVATGRAGLKARGIDGIVVEGEPYHALDWSDPPQSAEARRLLAPRTELISMLRSAVTDGTGSAVAHVPGAVGKTGTSQESRDALFVGWNDRLIVGVWVGNDDNAPMDGVIGGGLPAEIWAAFLSDDRAMDAWPEPEAIEALAPPARVVEEAVVIEPPAPPVNERKRRREARLRALLEGAADGELTAQDLVRALEADAAGARSCNVEICARYYRSFRAEDCTYQPYGRRPREVCTR
jgi:penicillin-binding protein 1A